MEAAAEAHFSDICPLFFAVASSPAPILEALHPGLPIQRALLKAAFSGFMGHPVAGSGASRGLAASSVSAAAADLGLTVSGAAAALPPAPTDSQSDVKAALL